MHVLTLTTRFGDLDLSRQPAGTRGFEELRERVVAYDLAGLSVPVAALEDVIRSKEAAGRRKDLEALPTLRSLLAAKRRRDQS